MPAVPFPAIGQPMPRAAKAYATADKWQGWILAAGAAIAAAVLGAPVSVVRDRAPHGVVCGVDITLTIHDRAASVATAWHYPDADAAPRLVTAYPGA